MFFKVNVTIIIVFIHATYNYTKLYTCRNYLSIYIYIIQILCVCLSVKYRRPNCWTDHDQNWHAYADRPGNGSYQILAP